MFLFVLTFELIVIFSVLVSPIPEAVAVQDPVSAMCQQLSQGLSLLTSTNDFMDKSVPGMFSCQCIRSQLNVYFFRTIQYQ